MEVLIHSQPAISIQRCPKNPPTQRQANFALQPESMRWIHHVFRPILWSQSQLPGLVNRQFAIENGPVEIVDFPIKNGDVP